MGTAPPPIRTPVTADLVRGALDLETTATGLMPHRLPARARKHADGQLAMAQSQPSGVRLVFRTRATVLALETLPTKLAYVGAPPRPDGVYDLVVDGRLVGHASAASGQTMTIDMTTGATGVEAGAPVLVDFEPLRHGDKLVEIWLPWNETTELVALHTDAPVAAAPPTARRTWLHHGSSISHGSNSAGPTATWPAVAAAAGGVELVNLGFGGGALLDPFVARAIRDASADLISLKLGINVVNHDLMRLRAFVPAVHGFLDTIRDGHPGTPLLVVSPILCPIHEHTPGPSAPDLTGLAEGRLGFVAAGDPAEVSAGRLTLTVIRDQLARIVAERAADDPHLAYLDGRALYGEPDAAEHPLPDALHPDPATQRLIGERFAREAFADGSAFGAARTSGG